MIGGKPYCEYGWMPLIETVFYGDKILDNFIDNIKNNTVQGVKNTMNSNEFYKNVKIIHHMGDRDIICDILYSNTSTKKTIYIIKQCILQT